MVPLRIKDVFPIDTGHLQFPPVLFDFQVFPEAAAGFLRRYGTDTADSMAGV